MWHARAADRRRAGAAGVTIDAAHSWRKETELGSIEVGRIADFTVVDENPLAVDPLRLDEIEVIGTVFCGRRFLPDGASRRTALTGSVNPLAPAAGFAHREHSGGICDVAREVMRHVVRPVPVGAGCHRPPDHCYESESPWLSTC